METDLQLANNYMPYDIYKSKFEICSSENVDVRFEITSFQIEFDSVIVISQTYGFQAEIGFNQYR